MRVAVRKLQIDDIAKLQALVVENFDAIEHGLTVLDARLLLGHATIDVIGVDAAGALVLGAVGFTANEEMLLKAVEAYSWCLEYPESLARHYPSCEISEDRPPRLLFVVERVPDAFHRKIKQLGFPEVDCVEVRHLEFDGVAAVYFETLLRLRRGGAAVRAAEPEPASAPSMDADAAARPGAAARATAGRLQKTLTTEMPSSSPRASVRPAPGREPAPVVSMVTRHAAVAARVERPRPAPEPVVLPEPEALIPEPVAETVATFVPPAEPAILATPSVAETALPSLAALREAEPISLRDLPELSQPVAASAGPVPAPLPVESPESAEERVSFKDLAGALLGGASPAPVAAATSVEEPVVAPIAADTPLVVEPAVEPVAAPAPAAVVAVAPRIEESAAPLVVESAPAAALTVEALVASAAPAASQPPLTDSAKQKLTALPQEFAGLNFPNDGVLTRQWMEFLNQMSGSK
jgi:hypothetical protein